MSTCDLWVINGKSTRHIAGFQNAHGAGPRVWDYLSEKYCGTRPYFRNDETMAKVWALYRDPRLKMYERVALAMTLDYAFAPLSHLEVAARACGEFGDASYDSERVNHWRQIGERLFSASKERMPRQARGVALGHSVGDPWEFPEPIYFDKAWPIFPEVERAAS